MPAAVSTFILGLPGAWFAYFVIVLFLVQVLLPLLVTILMVITITYWFTYFLFGLSSAHCMCLQLEMHTDACHALGFQPRLHNFELE